MIKKIVRKSEGMGSLGRPRHKLEDITMAHGSRM
jgi:hypothetical protein